MNIRIFYIDVFMRQHKKTTSTEVAFYTETKLNSLLHDQVFKR